MYNKAWKNIATLIVLLTLSLPAAATEFAQRLSLKQIRINGGFVSFGTDTQPQDTCSNWGEYFRFDHTTDTGKGFLSLLLVAKAMNEQIALWYKTSPQAGTDQHSGCNNDTMSVLWGIGFSE